MKKIKKNYLKSRIDREEGREPAIERYFPFFDSLPNTHNHWRRARVREPGTPSGFLTWLQEAILQVEAGLDPSFIWDAGVPSSSLTSCTTMTTIR